MTRRLLLAWVVLIAVLCAGCGVRPSGVITGGPAPTAQLPAPADPAKDVTLYFVAGSLLAPVVRPTRQRLRPTQVLALLQLGPSSEERAANLTSQVPGGLRADTVTVDASGNVHVVVKADVTKLSATAVDQIVCTVRDALPATGPVTLVSGTTTRGPRSCPISAKAPGSSGGG